MQRLSRSNLPARSSETSRKSNRKQVIADAAAAASAVMVETLESRRLMAATAVQLLDPTGPVNSLTPSGDQVFFFAQNARGGSNTQIWRSFGTAGTTQKLLDVQTQSLNLSSLDDLVISDGGNVFFTANTTGGRHMFRLNTKTNTPIQLTTGTSAYYSGIVDAEGKTFVLNSGSGVGGGLCQVYITDGTAAGTVGLTTFTTNGELFAGNGVAYYRQNSGNAEIWRLNGTVGNKTLLGTDTGSRAFFAGDGFYFAASNDSATEAIYRAGATGSAVKLVDDADINVSGGVRLGDWVYFVGTVDADNAGIELHRANVNTNVVELVYDAYAGVQGGSPAGLAVVGNSIYFIARDGTPVEGTVDQELYRYDTVEDETTLISTGNVIFPDAQGAGVLSDYYFLAGPAKTDARNENRTLYRTNPLTDEIEAVANVPTTTDSNGVVRRRIAELIAGTGGLFFTPENFPWADRDQQLWFVSSPFSRIDPAERTVYAEGTAGVDEIEVRTQSGQLILELNGRTESYDLSDVDRLEFLLGDGADVFVSRPEVLVSTYVFGDLGDDTIVTGGGEDTITGGAGRNRMFGGAGDDRINGSGGRDFLRGDEGDDRLYGYGGNDDLAGNAGVDRLFGDELTGTQGDDFLKGDGSNDKLYGRGGNDTLVGGGQNDLIFGEAGNDVLNGGLGVDTLDGGLGDDSGVTDPNDPAYTSIETLL